MNATNRVINRLVLFLAGAALLLAGAWLLTSGLFGAGDPPVWAQGGLAALSDAWTSTAQWTVEVGGIGVVPVALLVAAAAVLLLTALLLVFVFTRGGGRSNDVLANDADGGRTTVDRDVADAILTASLAARSDVISASVSAYRVRRTPALELAVIVQPGASLGAVLAAAETAVDDWDDLLGTRIPIMLHLSDRRWRDALRSRVRVK